jgi:hypothetical protein
MTDIYANIGTPTIASRGFVPLAVEAGTTTTIQSLIGGLAVDMRTLLIDLKAALAESNEPLAAALNMDNLAAIIAYMERAGAGILPASVPPVTSLPVLLDEDGPASVTAARDSGDAAQINVTFSEPPTEEIDDPDNPGSTISVPYAYEIYLDGVYQKAGSNAAANSFVNEALVGVEDDGAAHTIRVLFVDSAGQQTRFGPVASFT